MKREMKILNKTINLDLVVCYIDLCPACGTDASEFSFSFVEEGCNAYFDCLRVSCSNPKCELTFNVPLFEFIHEENMEAALAKFILESYKRFN